jgi:hypothetical protein
MSLPREAIFDSPWEKKVLAWYRKIFSITEIETSAVLQWANGALTIAYFVAFSSRYYEKLTTIDAYADGSYTCWPYFQDCGKLLFLRTLPEGYSQPFLYMVLFGTLIFSIYLIYRKDWVLAHIALLPSFLWHAFMCFVLTMSVSGNYDYYLFIFATIFLFLPYKEFFLKSILVLFYFLSTVAKIHETWIVGTYFSALKTSLPLFPRWSIPFFTNLVIFMEMVGAWFLLSRTMILQRIALIFFVAFHLYSGLLVGYHYPATVLPMLMILFGPLYTFTPPPFTKRSIIGWILVGILIFLQFLPRMIPGDEKLTMEGNKFGLYMFEANHQCVSTMHIYLKDGTMVESRDEKYSARERCDAYRQWFRIHTRCERDPNILSIAWTFDHSINGGPFLRIVDVQDACKLSYTPFAHNKWIKIEYDRPEVVGYPVENLYD